MANFKEIIETAKQQECWSVSHKFNYGPIKYLDKTIVNGYGWGNKESIRFSLKDHERRMKFYRHLIRFVTDAETYFVHLFCAYDIYVDCGQLFWEMQQVFPEISRVTVWKWIKEHKEDHNVLC